MMSSARSGQGLRLFSQAAPLKQAVLVGFPKLASGLRLFSQAAPLKLPSEKQRPQSRTSSPPVQSGGSIEAFP